MEVGKGGKRKLLGISFKEIIVDVIFSISFNVFVIKVGYCFWLR